MILLRSWSNQTVDGDISTCVSVAEDSQAWPLVTSTNDNCLGSDCPMYKDCFVVKARKKSDGRRCGGGKPSSLSGGYGG